MKRIFTYLFALLILSSQKSFSQCTSLNCAASHTGITTNGALANSSISIPTSGCFASETYKEIFWEFFFAPTGGNFTQTFTPTGASAGPGGLDVQWTVLQLPGAPANTNCPVNLTGVAEVSCSSVFNNGTPAGPGTDNVGAPTSAGFYYAVGIIVEQGLDNGGAASYTFDISAPLLGGIAFTALNCPPILLPVKLSSFNAKVNNCVVNLDWTSATESDLATYEIQSSNDGAKYKTIATIPAAGTTSNQKYSFQQVNPQQGKLYYRLKMVGIDGNFEYSKTIAMKLDCSKKQVFVYPNPVRDILNINITNSQDNVTTGKLYNANGKLVYTGNMISGTNTINMTGFAKGIYMLQLISNTETQNIKIIK